MYHLTASLTQRFLRPVYGLDSDTGLYLQNEYQKARRLSGSLALPVLWMPVILRSRL